MEVEKRLRWKVASKSAWGCSCGDDVWTEGTKEMLDDIRKRKNDIWSCRFKKPHIVI